MRIGILGGSFNPTHIGHLIIAECAREVLGLDKVFFIPCNQPPHKSNQTLASVKDRLNMLKLSLKGNPYFEALDNELRRGGISYTVDTLREIKRDFPRARLFLIIGADLARQFHSWEKPGSIKDLSRIVVVNRDKEKNLGALSVPRMDISSSLIRLRIKRKQSIRYLVTDRVREYIEKRGLYVHL